MQALACQLPAAKALPVYWTVTINHGELDLKGSTDELDQVPQDIQTGLSARTHANIYTWVCTSVCVRICRYVCTRGVQMEITGTSHLRNAVAKENPLQMKPENVKGNRLGPSVGPSCQTPVSASFPAFHYEFVRIPPIPRQLVSLLTVTPAHATLFSMGRPR